jgi:hypothetical protein
VFQKTRYTCADAHCGRTRDLLQELEEGGVASKAMARVSLQNQTEAESC